MRRPSLGAALGLVALAAVAAADPPAPREVASALHFDADAAWRDVERLVALGPRPAGSAALARARQYIAGELTRAGVQVRLGPFAARTPDGPVKMCNIVAVLPGRRSDVIMLAGHYDTKLFTDFRFVGANDGGSSAALRLELGRRLAGARREFTYWVVFFDGEEARREWSATDGTYGSRYLAAELRRSGEIRRLRGLILLDMVGDAKLDIRRESYSTPWLTDIVWSSARHLGYAAYFRSDSVAVEDDHLPFLRAGVPAVDVIDIDYPPWHTAGDTLDQISPKSLQIVGDVILHSLPALETVLARGRAGGPE